MIHSPKDTAPATYDIMTKRYLADPGAETVEDFLKRKGKIKKCPTRFAMQSKQKKEPITLVQQREIRRYAKKVLKSGSK